MKSKVWKRLVAAAVTVTMLSGAAFAASADDLTAAANDSNLLRQGSAQTVTAASESAPVTVTDLALPADADAGKVVTVLVESGDTIRYILGEVSGNTVSATYQENGAKIFTMMAAQGSIDQGSLAFTGEAVRSGSGYVVTYKADLVMPDDIAIIAAENKTDSEKLKGLRITCEIEDALLAQVNSVDPAELAIQGNSCFELESAVATDKGISAVYKLIPSVVDSWSVVTVTAADVKAELQKPMSISCIKSVTTSQINAAKNSAGEVYTYGDLKITNADGGKLPGINALQIVVPAKMAKMTISGAITNTGVAALLNTDVHAAFMQGDESGNFRPDAYIQRCEVAQMLYNLLRDKNVTASVSFDDVDDGAWYADAVNAMASLGIMNGGGDGKFYPSRNITRAEFAAICARFAEAASNDTSFTDVPASHWAYDEIMTACSYGWFTGVGGGRFAPETYINRASTATIINRMLNRLADTSAIDAGAGVRFADVAGSHWAWYDIVEAASDHNYTMNEEYTQETWTK